MVFSACTIGGGVSFFRSFLTLPSLSSPCLSFPTEEEERETSLRSVSLSEPDDPDAPPKNPQAKTQEKKPPKTKSAPEPIAEDSDAYRLAVLMRDTLKANVPTLKEPNLQKWAHSFAVALRNDKRMAEPGFVSQVILWACSDAFWRANIQSPDKLREKFDQLTAKMEAQAEKASTAQGKWKSPAARRVEANMEAGKEAERLLFGNTTPATAEVTHDAR